MEDIEKEKLKLERQRLAIETKLKKREQQFQHEQFEANRKGFGAWVQVFTPVGVAVLAGLLGLAGSVYNGLQSGYIERLKQKDSARIERQKLEGSLIIDAIKTSGIGEGKEQRTAANLVFLADSGLITIAEDKLKSLREKAKDKLPSLPADNRQVIYEPPPHDGRLGAIKFVNTGRYLVNITLWHPDNGLRYQSYPFPGGKNDFLNNGNQRIIIGATWGIQLGDSEIKPVKQVATWKMGEDGRQYFEVTTDGFWK